MSFIKYKGYYIKKSKLSDTELKKIKTDLTVEPKTIQFAVETTDSKYKLYKSSKKYIIVPKYYGIKNFGKIKLKVDPEEVTIKFNGQLRDYQEPIVEKILNHMNNIGGGLLSVPCGRGKTLMAIYIAHKLNVKTLVVVHVSFLLNQWKKQIKKFCDIDAGVIRGKTIDVDDKEIVIGMIQSLSMKDYDSDIFKDFGLVIYDESHHCASKVFSKALMKTCFKYTLALSATPYRNDGLINIMHWFLGDTIYREKIRINDLVIAKTFNYTSSQPEFKEKFVGWGPQKGKPDIIKMMGNLVKLNERNLHLINIINALRKQQRKIIILSKYVDHLKVLKEGVDKLIKQDEEAGLIMEGEITTSYYIGSMKQWQREEAEETADIFFATNDLAREGLDIERLNTVVLATSQKDVNQSVGRAMRKILGDGDQCPLIIDFSDNLSSFKNHSRLRKKFYKECKYNLEEYLIENDKIISNDKDDGDNGEIDINKILETKPIVLRKENILVGDECDKDDEDEQNDTKKNIEKNTIKKRDFKKRII